MKKNIFRDDLMTYSGKKDTTFYFGYRISWLLLFIVGILGLGIIYMAISGEDLTVNIDLELLTTIGITLVYLIVICLIIGWLLVAFISKLGEEIIILVIWLIPFLMIISSFLAYTTAETEEGINYLVGVAFGVIFFVLIFIFRKKIRLSAKMVELGAEIVVTNPKMFVPSLTALIFKIIATVFLFGGMFLFFALSPTITELGASIGVFIIAIIYFYVIGTVSAFSEGINIAYTQQWYSNPKKDPSLGKAKDRVKNLRSPIARYAFLMTFLRLLKNRGGSRRRTVHLNRPAFFGRLPRIPFIGSSGGNVVSSAASIAEYLGSYTLVIIVSKNMKSVTQAFKESVKGVFGTFVVNVAGSIGINIIDYLRSIISSLLLIFIGAFYGYNIYPTITADPVTDPFIFAIVFALVFLLVGLLPLNAIFKPIVVAYQFILYQTFIDAKSSKAISSRIDKKTQKLIREVY